jgi:hypothetical protein
MKILLYGYEKYSISNNGDGLRLIICGCYSLEMAIKVSFGVSFYNMQNWKGIREKAGNFHNT